jgi:AcrR family transcriptional regulator
MMFVIQMCIIISVPRRRLTRSERQALTRAELLAAAARVFARRGYDGASVADVAEEAGYSHGAVYSNFDGKEDLFLALYEQWVARRVAEIETEWAAEGTLAERARAAGDSWMERLASDPEPFLLRLEFTVRAARDPELRERLGTRVGAVPLAIRRLVEERARAEGSELPAAELATGLQALSLGLALEAIGNPAAVPTELAGDLGSRLVEAFQTAGPPSER